MTCVITWEYSNTIKYIHTNKFHPCVSKIAISKAISTYLGNWKKCEIYLFAWIWCILPLLLRNVPIYEFYRHLWPKRWTTRIHSLLPLVCWRLRDVENLIRLPSTEVSLLELILYVIWILTSNPSSIYYYYLIFLMHILRIFHQKIFLFDFFATKFFRFHIS